MNSSANQTNTATRGGQGTTKTPANSGGSGIFGAMGVGATHGKEGEGATGGISGTGNRRPSQEQGGMFSGLNSLKRDSQDAGAAQRRTSMSDQAPKPGVIGQMWQNFTKGNGE